MQINTIEEALIDFREGKFVIVVDDEDRENEFHHCGGEDHAGEGQFHAPTRSRCALLPDSRSTVCRIGPDAPSGEQHLYAGHSFHRHG